MAFSLLFATQIVFTNSSRHRLKYLLETLIPLKASGHLMQIPCHVFSYCLKQCASAASFLSTAFPFNGPV